ncbi:hypothetical protein [Nocardia fluminea]|uniref:hypothetical protein n=1 Tax=Nocardia fluminea TaxID=134984 RepID=UPI003401CEBF
MPSGISKMMRSIAGAAVELPFSEQLETVIAMIATVAICVYFDAFLIENYPLYLGGTGHTQADACAFVSGLLVDVRAQELPKRRRGQRSRAELIHALLVAPTG